MNYNNINMLYYDGTEVSEGTDVNKTSKSKECDIFGIGVSQIKALNFKQMSP